MSDTSKKTVATPCSKYLDMAPLWEKCRAICDGEEAVKEHDAFVHTETNFLVPFSPSMTQEQYNFLKLEAELPGVSAEFAHLLVGALLRKEPVVKLPERAPAGALDWIVQEFGADGSPLVTYMDRVLWDEIVTTRGWTFVDYTDDRPVPLRWTGESVINWTRTNKELTRVIVMVDEAVPGESEFHDDVIRYYNVHELMDGIYQIRKFMINDKDEEEQVGEPIIPLMGDKPLEYIPAWPNNGEVEPINPFLLVLINKEIALYNKITRRNHLLYTASTYTPYVVGVDEAAFNKITAAGLGSWLSLPEGAEIGVLKAPTDSLSDLENAIKNGFEEMAKLGVRMLSPETSQSGVALQLRNASQSAKIGTLNTRVGVIMRQIIAFMVNWRFGTDIRPDEVTFDLQSDFNSYSNDEGWLRLITEWYESGHIPRSVWVRIMQDAEALPDDYDDEKGLLEIAKQEQFAQTYTETLDVQE